jgi:outer membrane receptor protein involved in Fe transport
LLAQLPANAIEDIEIITAPSARYDADGKAGIINIKTLEGFEDGLFAVVNTRIGLPGIQTYDNANAPLRYGADFTLNNKSGKWEWALGANYLRDDIAGQRDGYVSTLLGDTLTEFPSLGERSMERYNYSARLNVTYKPNSKQSFEAAFYAGKRQHFRTADILYNQRRTFPAGGSTLNQLNYFNENLVERTGEFLIGSLGYNHTFANKLTMSASALYEFTELGGPTTNLNMAFPELSDTLQDQRNANNNPLDGFRFNLDFSKPLASGLQLDWGYQYRYLLHIGEFAFEERILGTDIWVIDPRFSNRIDLERHIHALYAQVEGKTGALNYRMGLRYEHADRALTTGDDNQTRVLVLNSFFPSMNLMYGIRENLQVKSSYSRRIEHTTTFKMNPFPEREHSETLEQGDPDLLPEFVDLLELGVVKYLGDNSFAANLYYQGTRDVINRVNTVFNDSILNRIYTSAGNATSFGVELTAQLKPASWLGFFAGANLYTYRLQGELFGQDFSTQRPVFSLNTNATFKLPAKFNVQLAFNYLSERVTAQGIDSRFYNPSLSIRKEWMGGRFSANLQWLYMDMGLLNSNEQRITTEQPNFFTTTNYIYETDVFVLNFTYRFTQRQRKVDFLKSEFGDKEF